MILRGGDTPEEEWTQLSLREADVVRATAGSMPTHDWLRHQRLLRGCELLLVAPRAASARLAAAEPRQVEVVAGASQLRARLESTARRFVGHALGIVFSGGGARALAHLGVVGELLAAGLNFDRVAGVSAGAVVGATMASGFSVKETYELFRLGFVENNPTNDYAVPAFSIIRGGKTRRLLSAAFGDRPIEELAREHPSQGAAEFPQVDHEMCAGVGELVNGIGSHTIGGLITARIRLRASLAMCVS